MNSIHWIAQYAKKYLSIILFALVLVFINAATIVIQPMLSGKIVDEVIGLGQVNLLLPFLLIMLIASITRSFIRYSYQVLFEKIGQDILFDLRNEMYRKMQSLDFDFFNHTRVGDIMARMTGDTDAVRHFLSWVSYTTIENALWFIVAVMVMFSIHWQLTLCLLLVTPFIYFLTRKMSKEAQNVFFQIRESFSRMNSMVEENISGNRVVRAFAREEYEIQKFISHNEDYKEKNLASADVSRKYLTWLDLLASSLTGITLVVGGLFVLNHQMTLGDLVMFNGFLWMLNGPLRMSGWLINDIERFNASTIKIRELLNAQSSIPIHKETMPHISGDVEFAQVSFSFADTPEVNVLTDISFKAKSGETIGILGETGAGKSTLVHLITRFYDATQGRVLIDGKNIKDYPVRSLRQYISMVMQDVFLFSDTIESNINYAREDMNYREMEEYARIAGAHQFISRMPEGYQTVVGERGVGLSGGQKQRISLARALVKESPILILDDTTSAVDLETEMKIQEELSAMEWKKTIFIISHRISSVKRADQILFLEKGRIAESGTHEELLAKRGRYYQMYQKQVGGV